MQQIVINKISYAVLDMNEDYPFARVQSATQQIVLVRKNLVYQNNHQLSIIEKMQDILFGLEHQNIVAFVHAQLTQPNTVSFFYEYAPLIIDKWLLDLGEDVLQQLQFELTSLAQYLTSNGVKFIFDPSCLGLSKDIKIKYFLKDFTIDNQNKLANYKENQKKIANYFQELKVTQQSTSLEDKSQGKFERASLDSRKMDSFQTRESWGMESCRSDGSSTACQFKGNLTARVQDTKKRSLQLLARMKVLKGKQI